MRKSGSNLKGDAPPTPTRGTVRRGCGFSLEIQISEAAAAMMSSVINGTLVSVDVAAEDSRRVKHPARSLAHWLFRVLRR